MNFRDDSSSDELSDGEISKLLIVTQTPNRPKKHEGFDRTGDFLSRVKMTQDLGMVSQIHIKCPFFNGILIKNMRLKPTQNKL